MGTNGRTGRPVATICAGLLVAVIAGCGPTAGGPGLPRATASATDRSLGPVATVTAPPPTPEPAGQTPQQPASSSPGPIQSPTTRPLTPPSAAWLDTTVVGNFEEPPVSGRDEAGRRYSDHNYWAFCGAGSARVVLFFAGHDPKWDADGNWPLTAYREPASSGVRVTTYWRDGEPADKGRGYMLYLAEQVRPPSFTVPGVETFELTRHSNGATVKTAYMSNEVRVLNWEASGWKSERGYFVAQRWKVSAGTFYRELAQEIGADGYPALVAVMTAGVSRNGTRWTLPNWVNHAIPHWIAVVGYDENNFYYVDTCWGSTHCGYRDPPLTGAHPGTWSVSKVTLYKAMQALRTGYVAPTVK